MFNLIDNMHDASGPRASAMHAFWLIAVLKVWPAVAAYANHKSHDPSLPGDKAPK
jgi:hypothetical protein